MSHTVPRRRWKKLADAARREQDPRKFIVLVKQLYDLLNYGPEEDNEMPSPRGQSHSASPWVRAKLAERRRKAA